MILLVKGDILLVYVTILSFNFLLLILILLFPFSMDRKYEDYPGLLFYLLYNLLTLYHKLKTAALFLSHYFPSSKQINASWPLAFKFTIVLGSEILIIAYGWNQARLSVIRRQGNESSSLVQAENTYFQSPKQKIGTHSSREQWVQVN